MTAEGFRIGERVEIFLDSDYWQSTGWFGGAVVRVDRYSPHRSFFWVMLDREVEPLRGQPTRLVSVLNPKHIRRGNGAAHD